LYVYLTQSHVDKQTKKTNDRAEDYIGSENGEKEKEDEKKDRGYT